MEYPVVLDFTTEPFRDDPFGPDPFGSPRSRVPGARHAFTKPILNQEPGSPSPPALRGRGSEGERGVRCPTKASASTDDPDGPLPAETTRRLVPWYTTPRTWTQKPKPASPPATVCYKRRPGSHPSGRPPAVTDAAERHPDRAILIADATAASNSW